MKEETEDIQIGWSFLSEPGVDITVQPKAPGEVCPHAPIPRPVCVCVRTRGGRDGPELGPHLGPHLESPGPVRNPEADPAPWG